MRLFFAETGIVLQLGFSQVVGHKIKQTYGITKKKRAGAVEVISKFMKEAKT